MDELGPENFPALAKYDAQDNWVIPEQFQRLRALLQAESEITASTLHGTFEDDHLPGYYLGVTVNQEEFKFNVWGDVDASFIFEVARAPFKPEDHTKVVKFLIDATDPDTPAY